MNQDLASVDPHRRFVGGCLLQRPGMHESLFAGSSVINRLLLFDSYVIHTADMQELSSLARVFGINGLIRLLKDGILQFDLRGSVFLLPGNFYAPNVIDEIVGLHSLSFGASLPEAYIVNNALSALFRETGSSSGQEDDLRNSIESALHRQDKNDEDEILTQIRQELLSASPVVREAIRILCEQYLQPDIDFHPSDLQFEEVGDGLFRYSGTLERDLNLPSRVIQTIVGDALLAVAELNIRLRQCQRVCAVRGLDEYGRRLLRAKGLELFPTERDSASESAFEVVAKTFKVPVDRNWESTEVDVEKLLELRNSEGCRALRDWISENKFKSEEEIRDLSEELYEPWSQFFSSPSVKTLRFVACQAAGLIPGVGTVISSIDEFLINRYFQESKVCAMIGREYRKLFRCLD